jgi:hypothetical protein
MTEVFASIVYLLCLLTSAACAWLLGRSYRRTMSISGWCGCFSRSQQSYR